MNSPLLVMDAHVQAVTAKRLEGARRAELMRLARAGHQRPAFRPLTALRRLVGTGLISVGRRLQHDSLTGNTIQVGHLPVTKAPQTSS